MREVNAALTIAYRDFTKLLRDRARIIISLVFPLIFIGALGGGLQANLGKVAGFNLLTFTFTGVFIQVLFQSTALGIISLIEDRENDFSQEIFVSPISRYTIIFGKILGESMVAFIQVFGVILFGLLVGVSFSFAQLLGLIFSGVLACLFGGALGTVVLANMQNVRSANQIFPFLIFPQLFLAGVFNPIKDSPPILYTLSILMPLTYPLDFARNLFYAGTPDYDKIVLFPLWLDTLVLVGGFILMIGVGTYMFVRNERNR